MVGVPLDGTRRNCEMFRLAGMYAVWKRVTDETGKVVCSQILKDSIQDDNEFRFYPTAKISPLDWLQNHLIAF